MTQRARLVMGALVGLGAAFGGAASGGEVGLPRFPSISPDGERIVFSWRGDLWRVDSDGGEAVRLTSHPADETRSAWSPDGGWIAFESTRSGRRAIHVMRPDGTESRKVTSRDGTLTLGGWSADGRRILVHGRVEGDVYRGSRPYSVPVEGGPLTRLHDAFGESADAHGDGERYLFERGGSSWTRRHYRGPDDRDVFVFDDGADTFTRLTSWEGNDGHARWRDKDTVIYLSDRADEMVRLWSMEIDGGEDEAIQLTENSDRDITAFDVSADGKALVFTKWDGLYTARFRGRRIGEPERLVVTAPDDAFPKRELRDVDSQVSEARLSPDGKVMALVAFGDVFVRAIEEGSPTRRVTQGMSRERDISWSPDMSRLYFVSDGSGSESIYAATVTLTRDDIRDSFEEKTGEPDDPDADQEAEEAAEDAEAAESAEGNDTAESEGEAAEETEDDEEKPDYAGRWADALRFETQDILVRDTSDRLPAPSPDGTKLAFRRTRGDLVVLDLITGDEKTLLEAWDYGMEFRWSPTGEHIAYAVDNENFNSDIFVVPADGSSEAVNLSRHPDNEFSPRWSADGRMMSFISQREGDEYDVYMVMLDRKLEALSSKELGEYFEEAEKAAKKRGVIEPVVFDADVADSVAADEPDDAGDGDADEEPAWTLESLGDAYRRLRRVTTYGGNEFNLEITPGAERFVFTASGGAGGSTGVYSIKWDRSEEKRLASSSTVAEISRDGQKVVMLRGGQARTVKPSGGGDETVSIDATTELDHAALSSQMFDEMARTLGRTFYHPDMKGLDWAQLTADYRELAAKSYTASEFREIGTRLMGELNGSHLGVYPSPNYSSPDFRSSGRLGIDATPVEDGFRVDAVLPRSRTNEGEMALRAGDVITGIELEKITPGDTLDALLAGRVNVETIVTVRRESQDGDVELDLLVIPVSTGAEGRLRYDAWQLANAAKVSEWSGGRLGYLHIRAMGGADLNEYERDLYASAYAREGLLIDVRSNGGGWTTDRVLASLMYPRHAYTIPRGAHPIEGQGYPRDRLYIQRYNEPVNMLCNEKSFSNAEIISHAFKTLDRGNLVGEETYGGVISTGSFTLVDGTRVRQPFRGWYLLDGTDMENHGAMPDIRIEQTPEDEASAFDRQLKAAVDDLLLRLD
ncbi:MAG: S41 family peptidase [Planctomycetota bacterium]